MRAELIATVAAYTDDHTTTVLGSEDFEPDSTGLVTMALRPSSELAQTDTYYRVRVARSDITYYCVVPDAGPVQLINILVDPATLNPVGPIVAPLFQLRSEKAQANGYPSLDVSGKVPAAQLPESAGGTTPDATDTVKGIIRLTNHLAGTAAAPELSAALIATINAAAAAAATAVQPAALTTAANARGVQSFSSTDPFSATFGPCGVSGTAWTVCPAAYRTLPITASAGDLVRWDFEAILGAVTASADAEFDLAAINNSNMAAPVVLRALSTGTATPLDNGHGGMYCWQNNSRRIPSMPWQVQSGDLVAGTLTLALLYKNAGSGLSIGHATVYPSRVSATNFGKVPS